MNWKKSAIAVAIALGVVGVAAYAHPFSDSGYGMGPGMMGGYGGYGMGPGMMGGQGGYGMGPGMMGGQGGYGMGPGMMGGQGGYGMGPGMSGGPGVAAIERLDLNDAQRKQVREIYEGLRTQNRDVVSKLQDEMTKLRSIAWNADKRDPDAVIAANKRISELRQQLLANSVRANAKAEGILTPQQREQSRRVGWNCHDDE